MFREKGAKEKMLTLFIPLMTIYYGLSIILELNELKLDQDKWWEQTKE